MLSPMNLFGLMARSRVLHIRRLFYYAEKSIALALVPREHALEGQEAEIEILGQMRKARVITTPLFDADGARMRG